MKNYAMIPARFGSSRLKFKNLALINNKPLIYYAINAAKQSKVFDKIIINSDHHIFSDIAKRYNVDFYKRPRKFGTSKAKSDDVVLDFIKKFPKADIITWVNPIAPLQDAKLIKKINQSFIEQKLDSLITTEKKQVHALYGIKPINFKSKGKFEQTQNLKPISIFVYSIMMWKSKKFLLDKKKRLFCGKFGTFDIDRSYSLIIKEKKDLILAEKLMKKNNYQSKNLNIKYDKIIKRYINKN